MVFLLAAHLVAGGLVGALLTASDELRGGARAALVSGAAATGAALPAALRGVGHGRWEVVALGLFTAGSALRERSALREPSRAAARARAVLLREADGEVRAALTPRDVRVLTRVLDAGATLVVDAALLDEVTSR